MKVKSLQSMSQFGALLPLNCARSSIDSVHRGFHDFFFLQAATTQLSKIKVKQYTQLTSTLVRDHTKKKSLKGWDLNQIYTSCLPYEDLTSRFCYHSNNLVVTTVTKVITKCHVYYQRSYSTPHWEIKRSTTICLVCQLLDHLKKKCASNQAEFTCIHNLGIRHIVALGGDFWCLCGAWACRHVYYTQFNSQFFSAGPSASPV